MKARFFLCAFSCLLLLAFPARGDEDASSKREKDEVAGSEEEDSLDFEFSWEGFGEASALQSSVPQEKQNPRFFRFAYAPAYTLSTSVFVEGKNLASAHRLESRISCRNRKADVSGNKTVYDYFSFNIGLVFYNDIF
jgi:hypothetical protein